MSASTLSHPKKNLPRRRRLAAHFASVTICFAVVGVSPALCQLRPEPGTLDHAPPALVDSLRSNAFAYFRFINRPWTARVCEVFADDVRDLPTVRLHGDAHIEQFALTSDAWGLDDFDDTARGPALVDIVRMLGIDRSRHPSARLDAPPRDAVRPILPGVPSGPFTAGLPAAAARHRRSVAAAGLPLARRVSRVGRFADGTHDRCRDERGRHRRRELCSCRVPGATGPCAGLSACRPRRMGPPRRGERAQPQDPDPLAGTFRRSGRRRARRGKGARGSRRPELPRGPAVEANAPRHSRDGLSAG